MIEPMKCVKGLVLVVWCFFVSDSGWALTAQDYPEVSVLGGAEWERRVETRLNIGITQGVSGGSAKFLWGPLVEFQGSLEKYWSQQRSVGWSMASCLNLDTPDSWRAQLCGGWERTAAFADASKVTPVLGAAVRVRLGSFAIELGGRVPLSDATDVALVYRLEYELLRATSLQQFIGLEARQSPVQNSVQSLVMISSGLRF